MVGVNDCIPVVRATFQDHKVAMLIYDEHFQCDLALAISNAAVAAEAKPYYAACIYSGIAAMHENGLIHRFINSGTIFINSRGVPKVRPYIFIGPRVIRWNV